MDTGKTPVYLAPPPPKVRRGQAAAVTPAPAAEVAVARDLMSQIAGGLQNSPAFRRLPAATQAGIMNDLGTIGAGLGVGAAPTAAALGTPLDFRRGAPRSAAPADDATSEEPTAPEAAPGPRTAATETLARRAGALSDEIDFPEFVASLVHGTFDAIVDASIRQMETFADLVSSIAKSVDQFTEDNVTSNQTKDWLAQHYPGDLTLDLSGSPRLLPKAQEGNEADEPRSPDWLAEYGLEGQDLSPELIEEQLIPTARQRVGRNRLQTLATMVLLGMNRVVVRDGTISARLRFRAEAADHAKVDYAVSDDPSTGLNWGSRGSVEYSQPTTKVSTVGVNAQSDTELKVELFGEVKINFVSETLPLDRFVDEARRTLLERHARPKTAIPAATAPAVLPPASTSPPGGEISPSPPPAAPAAPPGSSPT